MRDLCCGSQHELSHSAHEMYDLFLGNLKKVTRDDGTPLCFEEQIATTAATELANRNGRRWLEAWTYTEQIESDTASTERGSASTGPTCVNAHELVNLVSSHPRKSSPSL